MSAPRPGTARGDAAVYDGRTPIGFHAASLAFLDKHADEAGRLGWTTLQLFGVHPDLGVIRSDFCGAMVLSGDLVSEVHPDFIRFERTRFFRTIPGRPAGAVPIWAAKR